MTFPYEQAFGPRGVGAPRVYSPEGKFYHQVAHDVLELLGPRGTFLNKLLDFCEGTYATGATDRHFHDETGIYLRGIQRHLRWAELMGLIKRIRMHGHRIIELSEAFFQLRDKRKNDPPDKPARPAKSNPVPEPPPEPIDLATGKWAVEFAEGKGWRLIEEPTGKLEWVPIPGREQVVIEKGHKQGVLNYSNLPSVLAYLRSTHKKE